MSLNCAVIFKKAICPHSLKSQSSDFVVEQNFTVVMIVLNPIITNSISKNHAVILIGLVRYCFKIVQNDLAEFQRSLRHVPTFMP